MINNWCLLVFYLHDGPRVLGTADILETKQQHRPVNQEYNPLWLSSYEMKRLN